MDERCGECAAFRQLALDAFGDGVGACLRAAERELGVECPARDTLEWAAGNAVGSWRRACGEWEARDGC